jgi:hypothetical protein
MTEAYDSRQVIGMDLHLCRSVLVRVTSVCTNLQGRGNPRGPAPWARTPTTRPGPRRQHGDSFIRGQADCGAQGAPRPSTAIGASAP